jgi:ribosomal protein S21
MSRAFAESTLVRVAGPEAFEPALRRFMKGCRESGLFVELKKRAAYIPPSVRRREKAKRAAVRRAKVAARRRPNDFDWKPERA